jgi:predicted SnoaL-like aldol condensation-catalyzing enzyme
MRNYMLAAALAIGSIAAPAFCAASETAQERHNKALVVAFYDKALNAKDFDAAAKYLGNRYTQHNPTAKDGPEGLKGFIAFLKDKFPKSHSEIKQAFADGDYVILHVHSVREPGARQRDHRHLQAGGRQGRRALGCGTAHSGKSDEFQHDVLTGLAASRSSRRRR